MSKIKQDNQGKNCPACGAPIVSEICAYCGTATGLNTAKADMEYPVLKCKSVIMNFWTILFPLIFVVAFGIGGLVFFIVAGMLHEERFIFILSGVLFSIVSIVALLFVLRLFYRYLKVKKRGKIIKATVYGYMDDNLTFNGQPSQIVKLLVHTSDGPRFILYKLGSTLKLYGINDKIDIKVYEGYFMI